MVRQEREIERGVEKRDRRRKGEEGHGDGRVDGVQVQVQGAVMRKDQLATYEKMKVR